MSYAFDILIQVKPEWTWLRLVESTTRSYLKARNYPSRLMNDTLSALGEAVEQLISLCVKRDHSIPFEVGFVWQDEAVQVHLIYDASVPLNPHTEPDYEVPSIGQDTDLSLEGLWLHIIRRTMDRVFFRVDGSKATLVMTKYYRAAELARRSWVMGLTPSLRPDLIIEHAPEASEGRAILHDAREKAVLKLSPSDEFIVKHLNGKRTLYEIYLELVAEKGFVAPHHVKSLYEKLEASNMLEGKSSAADLRKRRWQQWLSPSFSIPYPDKTVEWIHKRTRFMFHPLSIALLVMMGLSGLIPLFTNRQQIVALLARLGPLLINHPIAVIAAYLTMLGHVAFHEFAHGVTCKHFGGRIRELGIMWYMAMFIFFCDTTSAWTFSKKSQRIWVSLSGPLISWSFLGITAWGVGATAATDNPWAIFWILLTLMNAFGLVMNFNPLIRMDAYYMLVDWTGIPNLQKKAFDYLIARVTGRRSREGVADKAPSPRERRFFLIYGILSAAMSFFFILLPFWRLAHLWATNHHFTFWGIMAFIIVVLLIGSMLFKAHGLMYAARHREYRIS